MSQNSGHGLYESPSMALVFEVGSTARTEALNEAFDKGATIAASAGYFDLDVGGLMGRWLGALGGGDHLWSWGMGYRFDG